MGDLQLRFLPHEIISSEILPRLPPKSLFRFKCVSKQWNSLISSPQFAKLHLQFLRIHSSNSKQCLFISNDNFLTFNWSDCKNYSDSDPKYDYISGIKRGLVRLELGNELSELVQASFAYAEGIFIVGSCHGLICLDFGFQLRLSDYIFIWNPSIRELRKIPNPSVRDAKKFRKILNPPKFRKQEFICGFGYVSSTDDYKVVNVTEEKGSGRKRGYIFGLKTGTWRKIRVFDGYSIDSSNYSGLLIDEILLWRMTKGVKALCIIGFDLVKEKLEEVQVPEWIATVENFSLSALGRCLCVFWNDNIIETMEVSMLKEYGNWDSWVKVFSFGCQHLCRYNYFGLTEAAKFLVHIDGVYIRLLDLNKDPPTSRKMWRIGSAEDIVDYVETLISPFNSPQA